MECLKDTMTGTGLQGKEKSPPSQTETQVVSASSRPLSDAPISPLPCAPPAISLIGTPISSVPFPPSLLSLPRFPSGNPLLIEEPVISSLLLSGAKPCPSFLLRCLQLSGTRASGCLCYPCRLSSTLCHDVRNVTAMLPKGLASHPIIGLKKEEKKIVCGSIMERHQDRAINKRRDITCRLHVTGPRGEAIVWYVQLSVPSWGGKRNPHSCEPVATQPLH